MSLPSEFTNASSSVVRDSVRWFDSSLAFNSSGCCSIITSVKIWRRSSTALILRRDMIPKITPMLPHFVQPVELCKRPTKSEINREQSFYVEGNGIYKFYFLPTELQRYHARFEDAVEHRNKVAEVMNQSELYFYIKEK